MESKVTWVCRAIVSNWSGSRNKILQEREKSQRDNIFMQGPRGEGRDQLSLKSPGLWEALGPRPWARKKWSAEQIQEKSSRNEHTAVNPALSFLFTLWRAQKQEGGKESYRKGDLGGNLTPGKIQDCVIHIYCKYVLQIVKMQKKKASTALGFLGSATIFEGTW